ncbi:hypothetical protein [Paenibacillus thermotolerans]|uniref:hypothetical protein n=1 Tax=Paenibacillus thermotolerans TaxID=3027807 RepID=UPI0023681C9E|nr:MULTISPECIES: hypothetical protein [unclassified Paenibacillus]
MEPQIKPARGAAAADEAIEIELPFAVLRVYGGGYFFKRKLRKAVRMEGVFAEPEKPELVVRVDRRLIAFSDSSNLGHGPFYAALKRLYGGLEIEVPATGGDEELIGSVVRALKLFRRYLSSNRVLFEPVSVDPVQSSSHSTLIQRCVNMNPEQMSRFGLKENDYVVVIHPVSLHAAEGIVKQNRNVKPGQMFVTRGLKQALGIKGKDHSHEVIVSIPKAAQGFTIIPQMVSKIEQNKIVVSQNIFRQLDPNAAMFELYNRITRSSLDIPREQIEAETEEETEIPDKAKNRIRLHYLHRALLDVDAPAVLEPQVYKTFMQHSSLSDEEKDLLRECYENDKVAPLTFDLRRRLKSIFDKAADQPIMLKPVPAPEEKRRPSDVSALPGKLKRLALRWLIGYHTMSLKAIRPCSVDESSNVVRLTSTMLRMIGIENTDNVIVSYRNQEIKARVLEVEADYFDNMKETNAIVNNSDFEMCIGIPSHMRNKLGMNGIHCVCRVRRDTGYIFMKHVHSQIVPTIGIVFAVGQFSISYAWKIAVVIAALCLSLYVGFANERNKINT